MPSESCSQTCSILCENSCQKAYFTGDVQETLPIFVPAQCCPFSAQSCPFSCSKSPLEMSNRDLLRCGVKLLSSFPP